MPLISNCSMMPAWHQLVSMSGHVEESETARKLQLYATSIYQVHSFVCQLDYICYVHFWVEDFYKHQLLIISEMLYKMFTQWNHPILFLWYLFVLFCFVFLMCIHMFICTKISYIMQRDVQGSLFHCVEYNNTLTILCKATWDGGNAMKPHSRSSRLLADTIPCFVACGVGWFTKNEIGIFQRNKPSFCSVWLLKSYLQNLKKKMKSLWGATRQWNFVHKVSGVNWPFSLQHKRVILIFPDCAKN